MAQPERPNKQFREQLKLPRVDLICTLEQYEGKSPRLNGLKMLQMVHAGTPEIYAIKDVVFRAWQMNDGSIPDDVRTELYRAYEDLERRFPGKGVHIGRAFYVPGIDEPQGPRTADIKRASDFVRESERFYEFAEEAEYDREGAEIPLLSHPFLDTTIENPKKPYPGGAAFMWDDGTIEIHATFGQDEAVQSFPHDVYQVKKTRDGYETAITKHTKKETLIPIKGEYKKKTLDKKIQKDQALKIDEIAHIARVLWDLEKEFKGKYRVEFIGQPEGIIFRECTPFVSLEQVEENIDITSSVFVVADQSPEEIQRKLREHAGKDLVAYLHQTLFEGRNFRLLDNLVQAAQQVNLAVLAYGNSGVTGHRVRNLRDHGVPVLFIGEEPITDGEKIRVYSREKKPYFEKENPVQSLALIREDKLRWGGKAVGLKRLIEAGFPTVSGSGAETTVFRNHLKKAGIENELRRLPALSKDAPEELKRAILESIQTKIRTTSLDEKALSYILGALEQLDAQEVSIRSSATCEDEADNAFAGRFESIIGVDKTNKKEVEAAVKSVLASVFRLGVFDTANNPMVQIPFESIEMALVCHEKLPDERQGAMHTSHEGGTVAIEAGQGSEVVDMHPRLTVVIKRDTDEIQLRTGEEKEFLSDSQIHHLRDWALEIEAVFDNPQEVEWVLKGNDVVFLQTRPL